MIHWLAGHPRRVFFFRVPSCSWSSSSSSALPRFWPTCVMPKTASGAQSRKVGKHQKCKFCKHQKCKVCKHQKHFSSDPVWHTSCVNAVSCTFDDNLACRFLHNTGHSMRYRESAPAAVHKQSASHQILAQRASCKITPDWPKRGQLQQQEQSIP